MISGLEAPKCRRVAEGTNMRRQVAVRYQLTIRQQTEVVEVTPPLRIC